MSIKGQFQDTYIHEGNRRLMRESLERDGYLLIRSAVPTQERQSLLASICSILAAHGWIDAERPLERVANPERSCSESDESFKAVHDQVFELEALHRFPHLPALRSIMSGLVGEELLVHPKHAIRLIFPNHEAARVRAHQDHTAVQGDPRSFTAWVPLHDCSIACGPLAVQPGSHTMGLRASENSSGYIALTPEDEERWVQGDLNAGDLLIFHSMTVHQALPNRSDRIRVSLDWRFQSANHAVNPAAFVFAGSGRKSWDKVYRNWKSEDLQYYWSSFPLQFSPSIRELQALSATAESPALRTRYANILDRIEAQMNQTTSRA